MTTLTNRLTDPGGNPVAGAVVSATLIGGPFLADGSAEAIGRAQTVTAADGTWSLTLTPTGSIEGTSYYVVREAGRDYAVTIPATGSVSLRAALITAPVVGVPVLGLSKAVADTLYQPLGAAPGGALTKAQADTYYDPLGAAAARLSQAQANALYDPLGAAAAVTRQSIGARGAAEKLTLPEQHGYLGESIDPAGANASIGPNTGQLVVARIYVPKAGTVNTIGVAVVTAGAGLTAGQNLLGLYDDAGNLLSSTADQSTAWGTTGAKLAALAAGQAVAADSFVRVGLLFVGTTAPTFRSGSGSSISPGIGLSGAALRFGAGSSGLTALPSSINLAALVGASSYVFTLT